MNDYIYQNTTYEITSHDALGGNFSDMITLSFSNKVYVGNDTTGATLWYTLVDSRIAGTYDTVYFDDDTTFDIYNDTF